jgi:hypothetical protein
MTSSLNAGHKFAQVVHLMVKFGTILAPHHLLTKMVELFKLDGTPRALSMWTRRVGAFAI